MFFLLPDTPGNKMSAIPRCNSLTDCSLTETPKSSLSFGQEQWRLPGSGLSTEETFWGQEHLHLRCRRIPLKPRSTGTNCFWPITDPKHRHRLLQGAAVYVPYWQAVERRIEISRTCHPATKQCLSHTCAAQCLKYPIALAFIMLGACILQPQNLFLELMRQCFPDSLWQYFSLIVFMLLFFCCYFHGPAPANPGSIVKMGPHGKQLPLLWELTYSSPRLLSFLVCTF